MKKLHKIFTIILIWFFCFTIYVYWQDVSIIPQWTNVEWYVSWVSQWGKVWENYRNTVENWNLTLWQQLSSWIMSWDTILDYCVYLVRFLGEVALLAWAVAIIFLWYKRITKNIFMDTPPFLKVIIWILVVISAYVIVKLIWSAFIS